MDSKTVKERKQVPPLVPSGEAQNDQIAFNSRSQQVAIEHVINATDTIDPDQEQDIKQHGDLSIYRYYFNAIGSMNTLLFFFYQALYAFLTAFPNVWLEWWADANTRHPGQQIPLYLGVYAALQVLALISIAMVARHGLNTITTSSGARLHRRLLNTVMSAPMSFFSTTDTGVTTNRFSQDIQIIDTELPIYLFDTVETALGMIASVGLISSSSYYTAIAFVPIGVSLYFIQRFYLRTSRQLRFMDLEAKSPLYSQFLETLSGLSTIRAFQWQEDNRKLNTQLLDTSQQPFYLLYMVQRWLTLVMDFVGAALAVFVVTIAVQLRNTVSAGFTGVALVNLISFIDNLKNLILVWTMLETSIGAVSRIRSFEAETTSENLPSESSMPPENWPTSGEVEIRGITASYKPGSESVLDNVCLHVKAEERVGICGRSGSGKSTLILALARMIEISSGSILIDSLDVLNIPRQSVRMCLNVIPQDPYFLHGTVRLNLDPYETASTAEVTTALDRAGLLGIIQDNGGLEADMNAALLSHGQRQLFCLVRAMLRPGKILILDEATSSVDTETDRLMQTIIREDFAGHTIIAIAHRIHTLLDFDRVVVMEKGKVVECESPTALLGRKSVFRELYDMDGEKMRKGDEGTVA